MRSQPFSKLRGAALLFGLTIAGVLVSPSGVLAQALKDLQTPDKPLVLKAQGSFFVGGEKVEQTQGELGDLGPGGHITVDQMYVRYIGQRIKARSPLANTIVTALGNGSAGSGYIPTEEAFNRYTFQVLGSRLKPGCAEDAIVSAAVGLLTDAMQ